MVIFNSYFDITRGYSPLNPIKPPFSYGFPMIFLWFGCQHDSWPMTQIPHLELIGLKTQNHCVGVTWRHRNFPCAENFTVSIVRLKMRWYLKNHQMHIYKISPQNTFFYDKKWWTYLNLICPKHNRQDGCGFTLGCRPGTHLRPGDHWCRFGSWRL